MSWARTQQAPCHQPGHAEGAALCLQGQPACLPRPTRNPPTSPLAGSLPASWGGLSVLQGLDLSDNNLSGLLPPEWGDLSNLQVGRRGG